MARLLIVSRSMALAMRLADQHDVTEHPADDIDGLLPEIDADVLVLDVGDAVLAVNTVNALREADQDIPVLLVSGYQPEWEQVEAQRVEGVHVVPLPITRAALLLGIAELVGGEPPALTPASGFSSPDAVGREVLPGPPSGPIVGIPPENYQGSMPEDDETSAPLSSPAMVPSAAAPPTTALPLVPAAKPAPSAPAPRTPDTPPAFPGPAIPSTPSSAPATPSVPFRPAAELPAPPDQHYDPDQEYDPDLASAVDLVPDTDPAHDTDPSIPVGSEAVQPEPLEPLDDEPAEPVAEPVMSTPPFTPPAGIDHPAPPVPSAPDVDVRLDDDTPRVVLTNSQTPTPPSPFAPPAPDRTAVRPAARTPAPAQPQTNGTAWTQPSAPPEEQSLNGDHPLAEPDPRRPFAPSRWLRGSGQPRLGGNRKLQRPPENTGDPLSPAAYTGGTPTPVLTPPPGLTVGHSDLERRLDEEAAALLNHPGGEGIAMRTPELVRLLTDRAGDLYGVSDTAQVLADDVIERADADAVAVLVPDGPVWRVNGGVGLRPLERRLQLDETHWLIAEIGSAGRAVLIEDTDIIRQELAGAPLAAWRHLLAVPVPDVRAIVILARGQEGGPFTDRDLTAVIQPVREASALLLSAVETRRLARLLGPLREQEGDSGVGSRRPNQ